jgi:hypothetical protein
MNPIWLLATPAVVCSTFIDTGSAISSSSACCAENSRWQRAVQRRCAGRSLAGCEMSAHLMVMAMSVSRSASLLPMRPSPLPLEDAAALAAICLNCPRCSWCDVRSVASTRWMMLRRTMRAASRGPTREPSTSACGEFAIRRNPVAQWKFSSTEVSL